MQAIVAVACKAANLDVTAEFMRATPHLSARSRTIPQWSFGHSPTMSLAELKALTYRVADELAASDAIVAKVRDSYRAFMQQSAPWQRLAEQSYLETRRQPPWQLLRGRCAEKQ